MKAKLGRRGAIAAVGVAVAAASASGMSAGAASASAEQWVPLITTNGVGIYASSWNLDPNTKIARDLFPDGDQVMVSCWTRGDDINNQGNVWYRTYVVYYTWDGTVDLGRDGYTYGAYVDGNVWFHNNEGDECP